MRFVEPERDTLPLQFVEAIERDSFDGLTKDDMKRFEFFMSRIRPYYELRREGEPWEKEDGEEWIEVRILRTLDDYAVWRLRR